MLLKNVTAEKTLEPFFISIIIKLSQQKERVMIHVIAISDEHEVLKGQGRKTKVKSGEKFKVNDKQGY